MIKRCNSNTVIAVPIEIKFVRSLLPEDAKETRQARTTTTTRRRTLEGRWGDGHRPGATEEQELMREPHEDILFFLSLTDFNFSPTGVFGYFSLCPVTPADHHSSGPHICAHSSSKG